MSCDWTFVNANRAMIESIERFIVHLDHFQIETAWDFAAYHRGLLHGFNENNSLSKPALYTNCIPIPHAQT